MKVARSTFMLVEVHRVICKLVVYNFIIIESGLQVAGRCLR